MAHNGFTWVIEGDVKACFDEISYKAILWCVREKVMDNKFLDLLSRLLKAGVKIDGVVHPTTKGVPQGGVVAPPTILQTLAGCLIGWSPAAAFAQAMARAGRCRKCLKTGSLRQVCNSHLGELRHG
jgi:hypothetical protein